VSFSSQRRVLLLYNQLTMRDVYEAAGPGEIDQVLRLFGWPAHCTSTPERWTTGCAGCGS
jgi:hypothetical protein